MTATSTGPAAPLLEVTDLRVTFDTEDGVVRAVDGVSFELSEGETLGIVGESGSGKSVTMMSVMRLIIDPNAHFAGSVAYRGQDLMALDKKEMRAVRGSEVAMIFQDPMTSLNPVYKVGWQIAEQIRAHRKVSKAEANQQAVELLAAVGIPNPERRADDYPHHFSGGMRQRVMIALALSCDPRVLIADEPTTALDVTIQAQILALIKKLRTDFGSIARLDRPKPERLNAIPGSPPSLTRLPTGCAFAERCAYRFDKCAEVPPLHDRVGNGHLDACHLSAEEKQLHRSELLLFSAGLPEALTAGEDAS
jgi:oligopeptide/dipeptide ABC transporter ATP-binding protein